MYWGINYKCSIASAGFSFCWLFLPLIRERKTFLITLLNITYNCGLLCRWMFEEKLKCVLKFTYSLVRPYLKK